MLHAYSDLRRLDVRALDGAIGAIKDVFFDDARWTMRYLVVSTGEWFTGRRVLIAPYAVRACDWAGQRIELDLTREQIRNSPGVDADKPVSRQQEIAYLDYYGYPYYWTGSAWGGTAGSLFGFNASAQAQMEAAAAAEAARETRSELEQGDPHLRSAHEVAGYRIEAQDGSIGHVEDFLFDEADWSLRYFIVDTGNWLTGRKVLVSHDWIDEVSWADREVRVALLKEEVRNSPEWDPTQFSDTEEDALHRHYGRTRSQATRVQIR